MITLLTGLPGNGKTLRALQMVEELCRKDNRPLFVMGIELTDEFPIPWEVVPPVKEWTEVRPLKEDPSLSAPHFTFPENAVILIDECQKVWRPRSSSSVPPPTVQAFETHRHEGIDFVLMTQHPSFIDVAIRRLTNRHIHMVRVWGAQAANIHEWQQVKNNPEDVRTNSQEKPWIFPKHIYKWYRSAKAHTYKFRPPLRALLLIVGPVALVYLCWAIYSWFAHRNDKPAADPATSSASSSPASSNPPNSPASALSAYLPRVPGLPHTAPRYDQITQPVDAPAPAGCVSVGSKCSCFSSQGTVLDISPDMCNALVRTGYFKDWNNEVRKDFK
ncbi:zonular occludens toxin domain-containing protein [Azospira sp. I09]|uniref:zonular occludens toxin domain-containing protein n=1 Tax=Azospira sp. I09 TaxID=1765049 RepID=UPI00129F6633|nr:zonular occludens toxin domain-containing protein [Azospira sp. I09]BBN88572.1 hypothetical protein AZSP09_15950 [Azospira sp. I09]